MSATIIDLSSRVQLAGAKWREDEAEAAALGELRRARLRIAHLERNLTQAMRDSLVNFNRAREAERKLEEREKVPFG